MSRWWFILFLLVACTNKKDKPSDAINFYHWKAETTLSALEKKALDSLKTETIYFRYFDVDLNDNNQIFPISVIREIDSEFKNFNIIPTVYITNQTLSKVEVVDTLVNQVAGLINQMHQHHFDSKPKSIQIDCDWTESTKEVYFEFLSQLNQQYEVSTTIRLHQIKYQEKTGVPPCKYGALMLYNMGDIKDSSTNSIFSMDIVKNYINSKTTYPLALSLALPIYKWGIITLPSNQTKIINNLSKSNIDSLDGIHQIAENSYQMDSGMFIKKQYLPEHTKIKLEEVNIFELQEAISYLKDIEGLTWKEIILYHLEESNLNEVDVQELKHCNLN